MKIASGTHFQKVPDDDNPHIIRPSGRAVDAGDVLRRPADIKTADLYEACCAGTVEGRAVPADTKTPQNINVYEKKAENAFVTELKTVSVKEKQVFTRRLTPENEEKLLISDVFK
jgi:hypothetical protein